MTEAYNLLFTIALAVLGVLLFLCLLRAILGPRIADRVVGMVPEVVDKVSGLINSKKAAPEAE